MSSIKNHTYLFYDFETTGINPCFDQVIRFAAIETDLSFNELKTHKINIKLRNDILPHPKALLVNRLSISDIQDGEVEYEAFKKMHNLFNQKNIISIGYNSLKFDDLFLRFGFYRNLFDPYSHQYNNNNFRADLFRIAQVYFLYRHDQSIIWPMTNNRYSMQLEKINAVNGLFSGMSHDAEVDVRVSIELAKKLFNSDPKLWNYLIETFIKDIDYSRYLNLPTVECINGEEYKFGILISHKIGIRSKFGAPIICKNENKTETKNILVFRLDTLNFENAEKNTLFNKGVYTKKFGEPDFLIPFVDKFISPLSRESIIVSKQNLNWIKHNPELIQDEFSRQTLPEYEKIQNLDIDASLYQDGFFTKQEKLTMCTVHDSISTNKNTFFKNLTDGRIKELVIRIIGRNFPDRFSLLAEQQYNEYLLSVFHDQNNIMHDYRGNPQSSPHAKLNETLELLKENKLSDANHNILHSLKDLINEKIKKQQDLGF